MFSTASWEENKKDVASALTSNRAFHPTAYGRKPPATYQGLHQAAAKYSKSAYLKNSFESLQCQGGTKSVIERSSKIDVLPQARKKKEFKVADHQQYKLASPECQGDNPVPLLHLPTRIVDDAPASEKCSFINFSIPLPELPQQPYVFRAEPRKAFRNGFVTYRKPKEGKQNVPKKNEGVRVQPVFSKLIELPAYNNVFTSFAASSSTSLTNSRSEDSSFTADERFAIQ